MFVRHSIGLRLCVSAAALLLSSCMIQHNITERIDPNGNVTISIVYNFSLLKEYEADAREMVNSSSHQLLSDLQCVGVMKHFGDTLRYTMKDVKCLDKAEYVIEIIGKGRIMGTDWTKKRANGKMSYTLNVKNILNVANAAAKRDVVIHDLVREMTNGAITQNPTGYFLTISMPGKIVSSPIGTIRDGKLILITGTVTKNVQGVVVSEEVLHPINAPKQK